MEGVDPKECEIGNHELEQLRKSLVSSRQPPRLKRDNRVEHGYQYGSLQSTNYRK